MLFKILEPVLDRGAAPPWAQRFAQSITDTLRGLRAIPNPIIATVTDLPAAGENIGVLVWISALNRLAISDGTNWRRTDTGATL